MKLILTIIKILFAATLLAGISGCSNALYLAQAVNGHLHLMESRVPVKRILKKKQLDSVSLEKLRLVLEVRDFATKELGLPKNKSYKVYSEIGGEYLGWNVYCAPKFSIEPVTWCFPIAGRVVYRGYFSKKAALKFANSMEEQDYDVYISPISAYSTLGWFSDPILSSNLKLNTIRIAGLIIHELAHQEYYLPGNSCVSESFAVTVERAGVLKWLKSTGRDSMIEVALEMWKSQDKINTIKLDTRKKLNEIYSNNLDSLTMAHKKDSIFLNLKKSINLDKDAKINNAYLIPTSTYFSLVPVFEKLLESLGGDFTLFYEKVREPEFYKTL